MHLIYYSALTLHFLLFQSACDTSFGPPRLCCLPSSPLCYNGATCVVNVIDTSRRFQCLCPTGYYGNQCQIKDPKTCLDYSTDQVKPFVRKVYHCKHYRNIVRRLLWLRLRGKPGVNSLWIVWSGQYDARQWNTVYKGLASKWTWSKLETFSSSQVHNVRNLVSFDILEGNMFLLSVWRWLQRLHQSKIIDNESFNTQ